MTGRAIDSHAAKYSTVVVDPPWPYEDGWPGWSLSRDERLSLPYPSMSLEEIKNLPVFELVAPEGYVFLWTTSRYLENAYAILRYWRMLPRQVLTWCKPPRGEGPGGMFATTTEFVIVAQRIGPRSHARGQRTKGIRVDTSWFQWPRRDHSSKPEAFLDMVERVAPAPYLEMFARRQRLGWDTWGDQALNHVHLVGGVVDPEVIRHKSTADLEASVVAFTQDGR